jgi:hypothetical protein
MARTPRLRAFRCLFRDARLARAHGVSLDALRELRAGNASASTRVVSRRAFLATAGVATTAASVPRLAFAFADPTVVIVGAGIAGPSCALTLADLGIRSTVYEASGRIGGGCSRTATIGARTRSASGAASSSTPATRRSGGWRGASTCGSTTCVDVAYSPIATRCRYSASPTRRTTSPAAISSCPIGSPGFRRPEDPRNRRAGPGPQRQVAPAVRAARLARERAVARDLQWLELRGHWLPELASLFVGD